MPTLSPHKPVPHNKPRKGLHIAACAAVLLSSLFAATVAPAQTLAQKNWAGSGVSVESWWRRGVFYRIDPARFQAPNDPIATTDLSSRPESASFADAAERPAAGATKSPTPVRGDLAGIARRLDYIQSLGVDAVLLAPAGSTITPNDPGWDDLARAAVEHHIRILVALPAPESQAAAADARIIALARAWLTQGVAGFYLPIRAIAQVDGAEHIAASIRQLHALLASVPGERILIAEDPGPAAEAPVTRALAQNVQLTLSPTLTLTKPTAASLRAQLTTALNGPAPLLTASRTPAGLPPDQQAALQKTAAAVLLASRSAVLLDYGEELGLVPTPGATTAPLMQWTPSNRTPKPPPPPPPPSNTPPPPPDESFKPYVPPLPRDLFRQPPMPEVIAVEKPANPILQPDAQPGFTALEVPPAFTTNGATANVALEDTNPASLLNLYRHLIQMHHDNASIRNGVQTLFDRDADNALVWLRAAPASSRIDGSVLVLCNLADKPLTLSLDTLHLRAPNLRTLLGDTPERSANTLTLPAGAIFLGELAR